MKKIISVIIPTHKRPDLLTRAVKSVLHQTYENFEVLIVNDDLEDKYLKNIISDFKDKRLLLYNNERAKGANGARNTGILHAKGTYIAFLDDDDELLPKALESQLDRIEKTFEDVGLVYGAYLLEKNNKWNVIEGYKEGDLLEDLFLESLKIGASSNIFIKKEVIDKIGLWDEELYRQQDLEFMVRLLRNYKVVYNANVIAKIYGHNKPNSQKAFNERTKFLNKVNGHLDFISDTCKRIFMSNHYRRQALYLIDMGQIKQAMGFWKKASTFKNISTRKDIRIMLSILKLNK